MKNSCTLGCAYHRTKNIKCPGRMRVKNNVFTLHQY